MQIASLLSEFDQEMAKTRKELERIPEDKFEWRPHPKSMTLGQLSIHLAEIQGWAVMTINNDSFDVAPPGGEPYSSPKIKTRGELLKMFDEGVVQAREALSKLTEERLQSNWSLLKGGTVMMSMPRSVVLRNFIFNHNVHHRAQLGVYLRMNDVPVPAIYGPSADEAGM